MPMRKTTNTPPQLMHAHRLIIASNRGPVEFQLTQDKTLKARRGSGGMVTALVDAGNRLKVTWVAMAMTEGDRVAVKGSAPAACHAATLATLIGSGELWATITMAAVSAAVIRYFIGSSHMVDFGRSECLECSPGFAVGTIRPVRTPMGATGAKAAPPSHLW